MATQKRTSTIIKILLIPFLCFGVFLTGCASGGFKLTRKYAQFVNSKNIIIRVVLYILTSFVFAITLLIDAVIFNTMDFWEGRVSANTYNFKKDGKEYKVTHSYKGDQKLRNTHIEILSKNNSEKKIIEISEIDNNRIQILEDGVLKGEVKDINSLPMITRFEDGEATSTSPVVFSKAKSTKVASAN